jgi:putative ABC transport system permease protein
MHIALREGREFDVRDDRDAAQVAIVSESMALRLWPGESPLGRRLAVAASGSNRRTITVVGVVSDVLHEVYDHSFRSIIYLPYAQAPPRSMDFALRGRTGESNLLALARAAVQEIDPNIPILHLETMTQKIANQTSGLRYAARLMAVFGGVALLLSAVGVYGVVATSVVERRGEIGIRMALGAQARNVLGLVLRNVVLLTVLGLLTGIGLALALTRVVADLIYGVSSWDPTIFTGVPALLGCVALLATYIPARKAVRVDPMEVLRCE